MIRDKGSRILRTPPNYMRPTPKSMSNSTEGEISEPDISEAVYQTPAINASQAARIFSYAPQSAGSVDPKSQSRSVDQQSREYINKNTVKGKPHISKHLELKNKIDSLYLTQARKLKDV